MKKQTLMAAMVAIALAVSARASMYSTGTFTDGSSIPTVFTGTYDQALSGYTVDSLTVNLSLSGSYAGDLIAYLESPNGTVVSLLYRPGVNLSTPYGNNTFGLGITLSDLGSNIDAASDLSSGTWAANGSLAAFNGDTANGTWTLALADLVYDGGTPNLTAWSLDITAVPEPSTWAGLLFGGGLAAFYGLRSQAARRRLAHWRVALNRWLDAA
jgi:subtilisin-like proprotein convertase family protein